MPTDERRPPAVPAIPFRDGGPLLVPRATARAEGMLMATTPCSARDAKRILAVAADLARLGVEDVAAAMVARAAGAPVTARVERALRHAVEAARASTPTDRRRGLSPSLARTEEVLTRLRGCQARLAASPGDPAALRAMDDAAYTLCVLMGLPSTHEAVLAAEEHLAGQP
ncbi:DUF5133 domain-containing protein [Streptomyces sp. NPDC054975]